VFNRKQNIEYNAARSGWVLVVLMPMLTDN